MISQVKDLALELGRTPSKREYCAKYGASGFRAFNEQWSLVINAAGLDPYQKTKIRITNSIFLRDIPEVLEEYKPQPRLDKVKYTKTLALPDLHFPWVNQAVLDAAYEWARINKPLRIIQLGDLFDQLAHSKFPKSVNNYTPNQEEDLARAGAEKMWATLRETCPDATCVQLKGNHDQRAIKRTLEGMPSLERAISRYIDDLMTFPGVELIKDARQEYIADGILFIHGYKTQLGSHRDYTLMNTVCGHSHVAGVVFKNIRGEVIFEMNCGLAGLADSKCFDYTPGKILPWTPSFGVIDENGPRIIIV